MPEELWQAAAELAGQYSANRVAKELRLNHSALMRRVKQSLSASGQEAEFIELKATADPGLLGSCEIEVEKACGSKLKIKCTDGMDSSTMATLWHEFLQHL